MTLTLVILPLDICQGGKKSIHFYFLQFSELVIPCTQSYFFVYEANHQFQAKNENDAINLWKAFITYSGTILQQTPLLPQFNVCYKVVSSTERFDLQVNDHICVSSVFEYIELSATKHACYRDLPLYFIFADRHFTAFYRF